MVMAVADAFLDAEPKQQIVLLLIAKKLMDCLQENVVMPDLPRQKKRNPPSPCTNSRSPCSKAVP